MKFTDEFLEELRQRISIEEVLGDYLTLKKQGKSLVANCPFHLETTPSLHISASKKLYHCFGCKAGGDTISFLMQRENYSFIESVKFLCDRYGIKIPESSQDTEYDKKVALQNRIAAMNKVAADYWHLQIEEIQEYLDDRLISPEVIENFHLGYSLDHKEDLIAILYDHYFSSEEIRLSGLVSETEDKKAFYDRFRRRLMIPILDVRGRVVAFGSRTTGNDQPKYINSPETALYVKGEHLYGLFQAKEEIRRLGYAILTEGYFDVIPLHENGILNAVANLGTALTVEQVQLLKRFTDKIVICYDGDEAGQLATERSIGLLNEAGFTVKVLSLPENLDPDEYIKKYGLDTFNQRRKKSTVPWFQFYIDRLKKKVNFKNPKEKSKGVEEILESLALIPNEIERRDYFDTAMRTFKIDSSLQNSLWNKVHQNKKNIRVQELVVQPSLAETKLLDLIVSNDTAKEKLTGNIDFLSGLGITPILTVLAELPEGAINFAEVIGKLENENDQKRFCAALVNADEIVEQYGEDLDEEIDCCIEALKRLKLESELEDIANKLKSEEDEKGIFALLDYQLEILSELDKLGSH